MILLMCVEISIKQIYRSMFKLDTPVHISYAIVVDYIQIRGHNRATGSVSTQIVTQQIFS